MLECRSTALKNLFISSLGYNFYFEFLTLLLVVSCFSCGQLGVNFLLWVAAPKGFVCVGEPGRSRTPIMGVLAVGSSSVSVKSWWQLSLEA